LPVTEVDDEPGRDERFRLDEEVESPKPEVERSRKNMHK
jgi:hypothetical protein